VAALLTAKQSKSARRVIVIAIIASPEGSSRAEDTTCPTIEGEAAFPTSGRAA